ncbi:MAG TPA: ATP-binding protein [Thermoanaerobaculia bacterium]|jgi:PAS domain S-box-containing protein
MSISFPAGGPGLPLLSPAPRATRACAALVIFVSVGVLAGWAADVAVLRRGFVGGVDVRPSAALALLLASIALMLPRRGSRAVALAVVLIGAAALLQYALRIDFGLDSLGFSGARAEAGQLFAMRMSPQSALSATLTGLALLAFHGGTPAMRKLGQLAAMLTTWVALQALVSVVYQGQLFLALPPIAPAAALLFLIWSIGFYTLTTAEGPASLFISRDHWGSALRRITFVAIAAPFGFGLLCLRLVDQRWIDARFAIASAITATTLTLAFTIVTFTNRVREQDRLRIAAETASRQAEQLYRMIVETSLEGICIADAYGNLTFANDRLAEMLGDSRDALIGRNLFDYITEVQGTATYQDSALGAQQEVRMQTADKRMLDVLCSSTAFHANDGAFDGVVAMVVDMTERAAARRALEHAYDLLRDRVQSLEGIQHATHEDLQRAHDSIDVYRARIEDLAARLTTSHLELESFSYSVSHDLRAPLRTIDGFSRELLRSQQLDERGKLYVQRIQNGAQRMSTLIDALLELSRVSHAAVHREPIDVTALATSVAHELRERTASPVTIEVVPGLAAEADPRLLRIGFENLIGNAIKFSARRDEPRIAIGATPGGALYVRDNGIGFDPAHAEKVFSPFQRLQNDYEGSGIGLAIVQRIIRRHGGSIRAESRPGEGTTFFFTLAAPTDIHGEAA